MSYLLDKKAKKKKLQNYLILAVFLIGLFLFRGPILRGASSTFSFIGRPFLILGNSVGNTLGGIGDYFANKKNVSLENDVLKGKIAEMESELANHKVILDENQKLKEIMNRKKGNREFILAGILIKPNRSVYDTLLVDAGSSDGVLVGQRVFALGDIPIGYVAEVFQKTSKIILYSSPGEKTNVAISGRDAFVEIIGRGGGNFEMILPRDFVAEVGGSAVLGGVVPLVVAKVETIISDPRDSYQKALLRSPVNLFELRFVEIEK